uniref:Uncharacterized protein n=1 Tax=Ixodes ricinus TaxID=34613 RepID=A0A6B0UQR2_IXORI
MAFPWSSIICVAYVAMNGHTHALWESGRTVFICKRCVYYFNKGGIYLSCSRWPNRFRRRCFVTLFYVSRSFVLCDIALLAPLITFIGRVWSPLNFRFMLSVVFKRFLLVSSACELLLRGTFFKHIVLLT